MAPIACGTCICGLIAAKWHNQLPVPLTIGAELVLGSYQDFLDFSFRPNGCRQGEVSLA